MKEFVADKIEDKQPTHHLDAYKGTPGILWCMNGPKFTSSWYCTRPENHTGAHECGLVKHSRSYWYENSDEL